MQTKIVVIGVVALGATALGGMLLLKNQDITTNTEDSTGLLANAKPLAGFADSSFPSTGEEINRRVPKENDAQSTTKAGNWGDFASRMAQFDADGDGILSDDERQAMRDAMRAQRMEKMDLDGDGEISRDERMAARQARFENSDRGQALMRQFDHDGNGVLDADEQAEMDDYTQAQRQAKRDEQIAQYDLDGDGQLSEDERQAQREDQRAQWDQLKEDATIEFDRDGDGQLNIEEQQDAINAYLERREIDRFIAQYDIDGDGVMGASDYSSFAADYGNGDFRADVNHDGVVDTLDLAAYRDLVTRSNNNP